MIRTIYDLSSSRIMRRIVRYIWASTSLIGINVTILRSKGDSWTKRKWPLRYVRSLHGKSNCSLRPIWLGKLTFLIDPWFHRSISLTRGLFEVMCWCVVRSIFFYKLFHNSPVVALVYALILCFMVHSVRCNMEFPPSLMSFHRNFSHFSLMS